MPRFSSVFSNCNSYFTTLLVALFFSFFSAGYSEAELIDRIVAVVNDDVITLSELDSEGENILKKIQATTPLEQQEAALERARAEILETLIDKRLIAQKAEEKNLSVSVKEVDAALANVLNRNNLTKEELLEKLAESGVTEENYRETLKTQLLQNKLLGADVHSKVIVTEEMITEYYNENYVSAVEGGTYYLLQMGFSWHDSSSDSKAAIYANKSDAKKRAERVKSLVEAGKDFGELARKFSDLPSKEDGGDLGTFTLDEMAPYMRNTVKNLKPGQLSDIIETPAGYQFYKLLSAGENAVVKKAEYDSVKDDIKQQLKNQEAKKAYQQWVRDLKEQAYIQKL